MTDPRPARILFICMGNICRSPAAEGVFRDYVRQAGHGEFIHIDSAGTIGYHEGSPPDRRMQQAALKRGYRLDSIARRVKPGDLHDFDLVVAMDLENLRDLRTMTDYNGPVRLLGSYLDTGDPNAPAPEVPDPYYGGETGFEIVLDMIESACPGMLEACLEIINTRSE